MADPTQSNPDFLSEIKSYESCLGKGFFGVVLEAIDTSNTPTAIKFIFIDNYSSSENEKLLREYINTKDLIQHPNIVKIMNIQEKAFNSAEIEEIFKDIPFDNLLKMNYIARAKAGFSGLQTFCIQMELCGKNLRKWLEEKHDATNLHIQIRQTKIIQGMISGLKYLHENKIIHRDLKPENIMFSKERYRLPVKIGDFGLSRRIHSEETRTGPLTSGVGTRIYMAPEVNRGDYGYQADLYSLGLIIWEVSQLIGNGNIRHLFDELVNDKKEDLVQNHPIMKGIKKIIIELTKRQTIERTKTLNDIHIDNWEQELLNEIQNHDCAPLWKSISNSEKNWTAKTSQELELCLDNAQSGCIIHLADGEYLGPFVVIEDGVQIVGNGPGTVMRSNDSYCLKIISSGCTISNFKISRSHSGIRIQGSQNTITQIQFSGMKKGIRIFGSQTTVDNVIMTNVEDMGITSTSNGNTISNITGLHLKLGIVVNGSNNNLTNINFQRGTGDGSSTGVTLALGSFDIKISNLICTGYSRDNGDWGLKSSSSFSRGSWNCTVVDSVCGPVWLEASNDLTLKNVHCGELISVEESKGVELINCRGKKLIAPKTVKITNCQFEEEDIVD